MITTCSNDQQTGMLTALLQHYCREFGNWSLYEGVPRYDASLAAWMTGSGHSRLLRIDCAAIGLELWVPLHRFSESGFHVFRFPAAVRELSTDKITETGTRRIAEIIAQYAAAQEPAAGTDAILQHLLQGEAGPEPPEALLPGIISHVRAEAGDTPAEVQAWFEQYLQQSVQALMAGKGPAGHWLLQHLLPVVGALGREGLAEETTLLRQAYTALEATGAAHMPGPVQELLHSNRLRIPGRLLPPRAGSPVYRACPNPLHLRWFSRALINPEGKEAVYRRYFPKEGVEVSIRPFDMDRDLEMVHEWFHREHARKIWKMDWPLRELEAYYRTMLPGRAAHSYIGRVNGTPTFNFEVYWVVRDMLCDYYPALPTDYGTHQFIAPVDPKQKFASPSTRSMLDFVFAQPQVGKMVGEGSVESLAAMMNKAHVGFRVEKVIALPHKKANLNFCYREWYWARFPESREIHDQLVAAQNLKQLAK